MGLFARKYEREQGSNSLLTINDLNLHFAVIVIPASDNCSQVILFILFAILEKVRLHNHDLLELNEKQKQLFQKESVEALYPEYYLIKINRFNDIARDTLDEWIYFLKNEEIKESFTAKGLKEAEEKLSIMKLPEEERKAYEHYKDDLHYQASMFESSYGDGYHVGKEEGVEIGIEKGLVKGQSRLLKRQLECRFGALPQWATEKLTRASEHEFETWGDAILTAPTLEALFNTDVASS